MIRIEKSICHNIWVELLCKLSVLTIQYEILFNAVEYISFLSDWLDSLYFTSNREKSHEY